MMQPPNLNPTTMEQKCAVVYIASQELAKISSLLPSNKKRSMVVHSLVSAMGLMSPEFSSIKRIQVVKPGRAEFKDLLVYHSRDYLDFVLEPKNSNTVTVSVVEAEVNAEFGLEDDCPPFVGLPEYVQLIAGASLTAANALKQDKADVAICWDGGRHHAQKSHASGFCYVADCILSILSLKRSLCTRTWKPRVMYLDLDLHFSDAVSHAFHSPNSSITPQVLTLSIHHAAPGFFPVSLLSGLPSLTSPAFDPFTLSLPLQRGASDATFARIWPIVEAVKDTFNPDYIVVQCGVDGLASDPCATFNWSLGSAEGSLGWCIGRILREWKGKKLLLGGGGYNSANAARAWSYLTSIALDHPLSLETEIPDHSAFPLYGPSFTLDVPAGTMQDQNSDDYIRSVEACFEDTILSLKQRLSLLQPDNT